MVLVGKEKKDRIMSKEERKIVSYHEVGHALISALQKKFRACTEKFTIVPKGPMGGIRLCNAGAGGGEVPEYGSRAA